MLDFKSGCTRKMDKIDNIFENVNLEEGKTIVEKFLLNLYFYERLSTKDLAKMLFIPIPLVTAIKKEAIKENLVKQNNGIILSEEGIDYVENHMGFAGINKELYKKILTNDIPKEFYDNLYKTMNDIFQNRVEADVTMDQSKCTIKTAINRVFIGLKNYSIIGKNVACIGDDDLISVTINVVLKQLYKQNIQNTKIYVIEKDKRIIEYIEKISEKYELKNIEVIETDLRKMVDSSIKNTMDCIYTDTPYTFNGLKLFVSRAVDFIKKETGLNIFLSFEHKSQDNMLKIEKILCDMGLAISEILLKFNQYEGAEILGGEGQLIILKTTKVSRPLIEGNYGELIYTGEIKKTKRKYRCKNCNKEYWVGIEEKYETIEQLKEKGCMQCKEHIFDLIEKQNIKK